MHLSRIRYEWVESVCGARRHSSRFSSLRTISFAHILVEIDKLASGSDLGRARYLRIICAILAYFEGIGANIACVGGQDWQADHWAVSTSWASGMMFVIIFPH